MPRAKHEYLKFDSSKKQAFSKAWNARKKTELAKLKKRAKKLSSAKKKSPRQKALLTKTKRKIKRLEALRQKSRKEKERAKRRKRIRAKLDSLLLESEKNRKKAKEAKKHGLLRVQEIETIEGKKKLKTEKNTTASKPIKPTEFYITIVPGEIALIEKSRRMKPGKIVRALRKAIEKNNSLELLETKLRAVEEQLNELLKAYDVKKSELKMPNWNRPAISLTELDRRITKELAYKPLKEELSKQNFESMRQRAIEIGEQAMLHRAFFEAARIYEFIQAKGIADLTETTSTLNLEIKTVKECSELLRKRGLIKIEEKTGVLLLPKKAKSRKN